MRTGSERLLAIAGGTPLFADPLHVGRPMIADRARFESLLAGVLDRRWLTNDGPLVREFESEIEQELGVKHAVATCNATIALEILLKALDIRGEVILPSFTFVATAHAVRWMGLRPRFCDVDPATHNLDPECVKHLLSAETGAILGVHLWGRPAEVDQLQELASAHDIPLLFDAAHAFGSKLNGVSVGNFGKAEVFSFHATKFLNSFEGGCITTNDGDLAKRLRLMRNFGFSGLDQVDELGTNGKMSEVAAAMGISNLGCLGQLLEQNQAIARLYHGRLETVAGIDLLPSEDGYLTNDQYVVVEVVEERYGMRRDELISVLHAEGILARRYFYPGCHRMVPYSSDPENSLGLTATGGLVERVLVLPAGASVVPGDVLKIVETIAEAHETATGIRELLVEA